MKNHSMIFDDFFQEPKRAKSLVNMEEMRDRVYADGVTYPNITQLPESVQHEIDKNIRMICGPAYRPVLSFARYSFEGVTPPHWAHSDRDIAQFLALIYLNDSANAHRYGTATLRHKELGMEFHPANEFQKQMLLGHANKRDEWEVTFECPAKFNRCFILNADLIHASMGEYGSDKDSGRLVISQFFNLDYT